MTKIKNYALDLEVRGNDKWIGTDSGSLAKLTKNFTPDNLAKYYNDKEVVESVNQLRFFYDTVDPGDDRARGSFSFPTEIGSEVPFENISNLVFSKYTTGDDAVNNFMTDIVNSIIIIQKADNPDTYAFYGLNGYEVDPTDSNFYNVALSFESGNGSVVEDNDYLVSLIQFAGAAGIQTILGSEFIDSTLTGVGEVTISLSATGTPDDTTYLRGDNTWSPIVADEANLIFYSVKNSSGSQILKGKAVMAVGTDGNSGHILIDEFVADGTVEPKYFMGVLESTLDNGETGRALHFGELRQFDTRGQNGEEWNDGDILWCDPANPGDFTLVEPLGPNVKIAAAIVINSSTNGKIKVRVQGNESIRDLYDTRITSQTDGDLLVWNGTDSVWQSDGTATIDYINGRVGIGTTSPSHKLDVAGNIALSTAGYIYGDTTAPSLRLSNLAGASLNYGTSSLINGGSLQFNSASNVRFRISSGGGGYVDGGFFGFGTTSPAYRVDVSQSSPNSTAIAVQNDLGNYNVKIGDNSRAGLISLFDSSGTVEKIKLNSSGDSYLNGGNVGIGTTSPGARLEVKGGTTLSAVAFSGPTVKIGDYTGIGSTRIYSEGTNLSYSTANGYHDFTNAGASQVRITNTGRVGIGTTNPASELDVEGRVDFASDIRLRGQSSSLNIGVARLFVDAANSLFIDPGNAGTALSTFKSTGAIQLGNYGSGTITGTATQGLAVDSSGNVIEIPIGSGSIDGSGTANYVTKWSDADTITNSVIYDDGTNVGIGTTTPAVEFHVQGNGSGIPGRTFARFENTSIDSAVGAQFLNGNGNSAVFQYSGSGYITGEQFSVYTQEDVPVSFVTNGKTFSGGSAPIIFSPGGYNNEKVRFAANGNVGIGTTAPAAKLDVVGNVKVGNNATIFSDGSITLDIDNNNDQTDRTLRVTHNGATNELFRIQEDGNVGIGTATPATKLEVAGVTTVRKSGIATPHADTDLLVTDATAAGSTAQVQILGGNAGNSHLYFSDTDNYSQGGIQYLHASDSMNIRVNATTAVTIDSSRNVGIGITSPRAKLEIKGTGGNASGLILSNTNEIFRQYFTGDAAGSAFAMTYDGTGGNDFQIQSDGDITLADNTVGNVGIGTSVPSEKLDIEGNVKLGTTTGRQLMFGENKYGAVRLGNNLVVGGNSAVDIRTGNAAISSQSSRVFINQVGFVGVGTTSPQALLDVNGPIKIGDAVTSPLANTVGTMRYREDANNSYVEMVMKTGASTYAWVVIQQNTW